jgi:hypothetical protein
MKIARDSFSFDRDLHQVRVFLLEIFKQTGALHYLIPIKVENQKFGPCGPDYSPMDDEVIKIWRYSSNDDSRIIAVSHRGSAGNYHIETHPDYKRMEKDLFQEIEKLEKEIIGNGKSRMYMYTVEPDSRRAEVLTEMDYEDYGLHEYNYEFPLDALIPDNPLPEGYRIRSLTGEKDYPSLIDVIGSVYDHCRENMTFEKMRFMAEADFYYHDLTLVVTDDTDRFVGFCMYRFDSTTRVAEMEILGSHPDFENLGLEEALLSEGLKRVMKYQPTLVCSVEIDVSDPLNQMLESAGFVRSVTMNQWGKMIEGKNV